MTAYDKRLHAFRPDLADERLRGEVSAARFVRGVPARVATSVVDLLRHPRPDAGLDTQLLGGDDVLVFDEAEGWAWVQAARDGYVGYLAAACLTRNLPPLTHVVRVPRTFLYGAPDMKLPRSGESSLGSRLSISDFVETRGTRYGLLPTGEAVVAGHIAPMETVAPDFVAVAETLLHAPYLWGGASAFGLDCAGLVQLCLRMAGRGVLRDSDMQAGSIGSPIEPGSSLENLERGDLVFWRGHVGIMTDGETMIHANGHTMDVSQERLSDAVARIGYLYGGPTGFRRP